MDEALRDYIVTHRKNELDQFCHDERYFQFVEYMDQHHRLEDQYFRYCKTFSLMLQSGFDCAGLVLETGHPSPITKFLSEAPDFQTRASHTDLRYMIDSEDESLDCILSFEVLEHIKDQSETSFDDVVLFNASGARQYAAEITRALKPGGCLYLTTPNATSYYILTQVLLGKPPALFRPHVREYTKEEVVSLFSALSPHFYTSHYSIFHHSEALRQADLYRLFESNGYSSDDRGGLHFFRFLKP
jgi:SAM-dependent methyltransferase